MYGQRHFRRHGTTHSPLLFERLHRVASRREVTRWAVIRRAIGRRAAICLRVANWLFAHRVRRHHNGECFGANRIARRIASGVLVVAIIVAVIATVIIAVVTAVIAAVAFARTGMTTRAGV